MYALFLFSTVLSSRHPRKAMKFFLSFALKTILNTNFNRVLHPGLGESRSAILRREDGFSNGEWSEFCAQLHAPSNMQHFVCTTRSEVTACHHHRLTNWHSHNSHWSQLMCWSVEVLKCWCVVCCWSVEVFGVELSKCWSVGLLVCWCVVDVLVCWCLDNYVEVWNCW
jgi:hypothetical protein